MTIEEVLAKLNEMASEKYKKNVMKLGIPEENSLGVATGELRKIARKLPKEKAFLLSLWQTEFHEAKILATLRLEPNSLSEKEIEFCMEEIFSWDLCDLFCKSILIERKNFDAYIKKWCSSDSLYYKRAAFTLIASTSTHSQLTDDEIEAYLAIIEGNALDERVHVKKAVSWALRELGKTNEKAREKSIIIANQLLAKDSKSEKWIAKDALKELEVLVAVPGRQRLISSNSKMGKEIYGN